MKSTLIYTQLCLAGTGLWALVDTDSVLNKKVSLFRRYPYREAPSVWCGVVHGYMCDGPHNDIPGDY